MNQGIYGMPKRRPYEHVVGATFDGAGAALDLLGTTKVRAPAHQSGVIAAIQVDGLGGPGSATIGIQRGPAGGSFADITGGADLQLTGVSYRFDPSPALAAPMHDAGDLYEFELKAVSGFTQLTVLLYYAFHF